MTIPNHWIGACWCRRLLVPPVLRTNSANRVISPNLVIALIISRPNDSYLCHNLPPHIACVQQQKSSHTASSHQIELCMYWLLSDLVLISHKICRQQATMLHGVALLSHRRLTKQRTGQTWPEESTEIRIHLSHSSNFGHEKLGKKRKVPFPSLLQAVNHLERQEQDFIGFPISEYILVACLSRKGDEGRPISVYRQQQNKTTTEQPAPKTFLWSPRGLRSLCNWSQTSLSYMFVYLIRFSHKCACPHQVLRLPRDYHSCFHYHPSWIRPHPLPASSTEEG